MKLLLHFLVILLLLNGCAYFNTFYNAEHYYESGVQPLEDGGSVNKALLDKSIEKSSKILQFHPKSKYVDDALLLIGKSYMYTGEYTKAIRKFSELIDYFPNSEYFEECMFYMGKTYLLQEDKEVAKTIFLKVVNSNGYWKKDAIEEYVNILMEQNRTAEADTFINKLQKKDRNNNTVKYLAGKVKYITNNDNEALSYLQSVNPSKLKKDSAFEYYRILTSLLLRIGDIKKAEKVVNNALSVFQNQTQINSLNLIKARILIKNSEYTNAINLIDDAIAQPGGTFRDSLTFLKGNICELYLSDYKRALDIYSKMMETEQLSALYSEIEVKVKTLELYLNISEDSVISEEDKIKNRFLLAEINYLNLNKKDDAISRYNGIIDSFPASIYAPKSMFAVSYIYLKEYSDTAQSISYLEKILERYPNSEYAFDAEKRLKAIKR